MKKFLLALAAALVLCVPAFATDDPVYFTAAPYDVTLSGSSYYNFTSSDDVYFFWRIDSSGKYALIPISESNTATYTQVIASATTDQFITSLSFGDYFVTPAGQRPALISSSMFANIGYSPITAIFDQNATDSDIQQAFSDFLSSSGGGSGITSTFNLPCGNVVYFQVTSEQDVTFKSYNQVLSSLLTFSSLGPWGDTGQRFGPAASLPSSGTSFPLLSQDLIHWNIDASSVNLLGQSRTAIKTVHCISNQWYAFYNPAYNSNNTDWTVNDITGATVGVFGSFAQVKVYPLEQVVDFSNGAFVGSSNDDYQSYYDGTIGSDGSVTFTDQNGNVSTPSAGGQNLLAPNESYQSLIDRVIGILDEIVHELKSLFTFGYEAVQDLVGIMRDFVNVLGGLYTWLPAEVYSALMSAVVVAIVIGVFKVFL